MNSLSFDVFCSKYLDSEAPISVITEILSENDPLKFQNISNEFNKLGFTKLKDLAGATLGKASLIKLSGDTLTLLYGAIEIYSERLDNLLKSAKSELQNGNFISTQKICEELFIHKPTDLNVLLLNAKSFFDCGNYEECINCLEKAKQINPKCSEVLSNFALVYMKKSENYLALQYLYEVCALKPYCVDAWTNYADFLFETNDLVTADFAYVRVLSIEPKLYKVRNKYGKLLLKLNKIKDAKEQFKIAHNCAIECPETLNNLAYVYYKSGKFEKAISKYKQVLEINPDLMNAHFYLGMTHLKISEYQNAANAFWNAIVLEPENVTVLKKLAVTYCYVENMVLCVEIYKKCLKLQPENFNLNLELAMICLHKIKNYQEAAIYFKKCIHLNPERIDLYKNLFVALRKVNDYQNASDTCMSMGDLYLESDDQENARNAFCCAILLNPGNAIAHWKMGLTMYNLGHWDLALTRYKHAIEIMPNLADAYCDMAVIFDEQDLFEKAIEYYKMTISLKPSNLNAHLNLADILFKQKINLLKAITHYKIALKYDNTSVDIYLQIGNIYKELNMSKDALHSFYMAIQHDPQCLEAYISVGSILKDSDNFIEAIRAYESALKLQPDHPDVFCHLVNCLQKVCDWSDYDAHVKKLQEIINEQLNDDDVLSLLPHDALMFPLSLEELTKIASKFAKQCVQKLNKSIKEPLQFVHPTVFNGNIKIGFVSTNFGKHPITSIMETLTSICKNQQVDVICYSISSNDNTPSWLNNSEHHKDLSQLKFVDAAKVINSDGIHVLVDMSGYTKGAQTEIFALRPAPVQVSWFGYLCTSGTTFMDYFITDRICSPPEHQNVYTEQLNFTNHTIFIGDHKQKFSNLQQRLCFDEELERSTFNLPENVVVFCNFSKLYKIDPFTLRMWITILNNVPKSVLWLLHLNDVAENNLRTFADVLNFDTSRIIFADFIPKYQHLNRIQLADIYLDTHLYNGHIACLDALWAGVPVITLPGDTYASRVTTSQLTTLGITDTIAQNEENYIDIAIELGLNKCSLEKMRKNIWDLKMVSHLFNINCYVTEVILILKVISLTKPKLGM
ncbi:UDP-N-acetylglucosamine--peptide N-acetylglucosaminyltransferase 110 kDa subunit-like [Acyrthosiphon pisum]|uniref:protein O-GlcNAc transferase n=1 Tax=Acyrthosiphon pisum TaxID=7029 RepID=A0A8R2H5C5_ACYPI|nr:UDP-N-acetylglucosamine--peptide N-acetylglucosaminyltransferase 110 kDa subunit-like [Acyrthosiphon pisum]|eukprot:XP_016660954.1 PREDICTED: UDP-N-acetylglucosamine--peptide N-acetylglucosaminyltransferase 110 kDa subunit-like [Acyrthosiphon pisum]